MSEHSPWPDWSEEALDYLHDAVKLCCTSDGAARVVADTLVAINDPDVGLNPRQEIIALYLDSYGFADHGVSVRWGFLTKEGKDLLTRMKELSK